MRFGSYFKSLIAKSGKSKASIARAMGLKRQNYINNIINGLHVPTEERVIQIATFLKLTKIQREHLLFLSQKEFTLKGCYRRGKTHVYEKHIIEVIEKALMNNGKLRRIIYNIYRNGDIN
jgi:transcriptional regulator with XRE-family HTH domain